jgi:YegS/Rv2252/BmrU family lipid kinase
MLFFCYLCKRIEGGKGEILCKALCENMLGIIINPKSGKRAFRAQRLYLWKLLKARRLPFIYRVTKYANHAIELARELVEEKGCTQILILGGDGTLSEVINGIMRANLTSEQRANIQFGIMPRGTGNDFARHWGLNNDFKRSLDIFFQGNAKFIDVGCVTYWRNNIEHHRYFINSLGFGIEPMCCRYAEQLKYYIGSHSINYFFALIWSLAKYKNPYLRLESHGETIVEGKMFVTSIANGSYVGGGMKLNPNADPCDGVLHSMFLTPPSFKEIMQAVPRLFDGRFYELPFVHPVVSSHLVLHTKQHQSFEADGVVMDVSGPCKVTCMKGALQMIVPKEFV